MKSILRRFKETPYELPTAVLALAYGLLALSVHSRTNSLEHFVAPWMVVMWCLALVGGGFATIVGRIGGWMRTELVGQLAIAYGIGWYTIGLLIVHNPVALLAAFVYLSFTIGAAARAHTLHQALKAKEVAQSIADRNRGDK